MKVSDLVANKINRLRTGYVFTYEEFNVSVNKVEALKKTLSRLVAAGKIVRLSKGQFYKPEKTEFGLLQPSEYQIVKDLLEEKNKIVGYITGVSIYNKLGLTTQFSNTIQIGTNIDRKPRKRGKYNIRFIRQKNTITKENTFMLQVLDAVRFIKRIPDADINESCKRIINIFRYFSQEERNALAKYTLKYNPGTIALAGAILEFISEDSITDQLYNSMNPATVFNLHIRLEVLPNKQKWRII
jgi:predicted transcriptional regulator of viral defense system